MKARFKWAWWQPADTDEALVEWQLLGEILEYKQQRFQELNDEVQRLKARRSVLKLKFTGLGIKLDQ